MHPCRGERRFALPSHPDLNKHPPLEGNDIGTACRAPTRSQRLVSHALCLRCASPQPFVRHAPTLGGTDKGTSLGFTVCRVRPLSALTPSPSPTRWERGVGLKGVGFLRACLLAALPSRAFLPPCERDARAPSTRDAGNAGVPPAVPTAREKTYPFKPAGSPRFAKGTE